MASCHITDKAGHIKNKLTFVHSVISRVVEQFLRALNRDGTFGRQQTGHLQAGRDSRCLALADLADEAHRQGLLGVEEARGHADVFDPAGAAYCLGQPAQGADVRGQPDVNLLDGESCVGGADPDIAASGQVDGQTY